MLRPIYKRLRTPRLWHRLSAWLVLIAYALLSSGMPLPAGIAATDTTAYPCQGGRCGCISSEQCWKSCCCHSRAERIAWAIRNGVTPPVEHVSADEFATALMASRQANDTGTSKLPPCCAKREAAKKQPACCQATAPEPTSDWVLTIAAQKCRGTSAGHWGAVPLSTVPATQLVAAQFFTCVEWLPLLDTPLPPLASYEPPVPPPRSVV